MGSNFLAAKFGMFIHWGLYAIPGGRWQGETMDYIGEWIQSRFRIPNSEYSKLADEFNPLKFNADEWVVLAKNAGMKYIVFTSKHHDGFSMFHTKHSPFNIVDATPFKRDVLREIADSCAKHDMKLGIYYSHCLDWHEKDAADSGPDGLRNFGMSPGNDWDFPDYKSKNFTKYFEEKVKPQITELLSNYGPVFLLWFDCHLAISKAQALELKELVHSIQPDCMINSRIGYNLGDFGSLGDNQHPTSRAEYPLESPNTLNNTWGFKWDDNKWLKASDVVSDLIALNDKNVNFLLNIGPCPDGSFPEASINILREVAEWRKNESVAIQNTSPNPFPQGFLWGYCTVIGNTLQFFIKNKLKQISISGLKNKIISSSVPFIQNSDELILNLPDFSNSILPVVKIELDGIPETDSRLMPQNGVLNLSPAVAQIIHGDAVKFGDGKGFLGTAAETIVESLVSSIDQNGSLTQWHHPGDVTEWALYFPKTDVYEVMAITENRQHSAKWAGQRTIELSFGSQTFAAEVNLDKDMSSAYYAKALSCLGTIKVNAGDSGIFRIKNIRISHQNAIDMNLNNIVLRSVNKS